MDTENNKLLGHINYMNSQIRELTHKIKLLELKNNPREIINSKAKKKIKK